jgi:hypothetical protein
MSASRICRSAAGNAMDTRFHFNAVTIANLPCLPSRQTCLPSSTSALPPRRRRPRPQRRLKLLQSALSSHGRSAAAPSSPSGRSRSIEGGVVSADADDHLALLGCRRFGKWERARPNKPSARRRNPL